MQNPSSSPGPQIHPSCPPGMQPGPQGQENLNALQRAIDSMEEKGMTEDPRYSQLLALRARNGNSSVFNQTQIHQLRAQIMAYRLLARNQPLTQQMTMAAQGKKPDGTPQCPTPPPSSPFQMQNAPGQPQVCVKEVEVSDKQEVEVLEKLKVEILEKLEVEILEKLIVEILEKLIVESFEKLEVAI